MRGEVLLIVQEGLEFLAFQNVGCSINACAAVRDLLKHPEELRTLHFYNNMSDDDGASSIAEVLLTYSHVHTKSRQNNFASEPQAAKFVAHYP